VEQYLFIELLWIIPIIGFGVFVSILVFVIHSKYAGGTDAELNRRVSDFNAGAHHRAAGIGAAGTEAEQAAAELEKRLSELEGAIESLTVSIAARQKPDGTVADGTVADGGQQELSRMLEAMRREYDAILHENRTLRSQFMKFLSDEGKTPKIVQPKTNLKLFDDTRYISPENFDDTADFEFSNSG
jgi:hypothetical protein